MTVKEAIEILKGFPENLEIVVNADEIPEFLLTEDIGGNKRVEIWEKTFKEWVKGK